MQFCFRGKGKKKRQRQKPNSMVPWVLRAWAKEERGSRPHWDTSRRRVDRAWVAPCPQCMRKGLVFLNSHLDFKGRGGGGPSFDGTLTYA